MAFHQADLPDRPRRGDRATAERPQVDAPPAVPRTGQRQVGRERAVLGRAPDLLGRPYDGFPDGLQAPDGHVQDALAEASRLRPELGHGGLGRDLTERTPRLLELDVP